MPHYNGSIQPMIPVNAAGNVTRVADDGTGVFRMAVDALVSGLSPVGTPLTATASQDLSAGALALTTTFANNFEPRFVAIAFSGALPGPQTVTITFNSNTGAAFDTVIEEATVGAGATSYFFSFPAETVFVAGDEVQLDVTNTGTPAITANATIRGER